MNDEIERLLAAERAKTAAMTPEELRTYRNAIVKQQMEAVVPYTPGPRQAVAARPHVAPDHPLADEYFVERERVFELPEVKSLIEALRPFVEYVHVDFLEGDRVYGLVAVEAHGGGWFGSEDFKRARNAYLAATKNP